MSVYMSAGVDLVEEVGRQGPAVGRGALQVEDEPLPR